MSTKRELEEENQQLKKKLGEVYDISSDALEIEEDELEDEDEQ